MQISIRHVNPLDYDFILELNRQNVAFLLPMDPAQLQFLADTARLFLVLCIDAKPVGFLIALREALPHYDVRVYQWFSARYETFLYIDRVVIAETHRGAGLGKHLYQAAFACAQEDGLPLIAAAIETIPYNEPSLSFHRKMGFDEAGRCTVRGGAVHVSLQLARIRKC